MKILIVFITLFCSLAFGAVTVSVNGSNHTIPQTNERGWGNAVTAWIQAISTYTLQPTGGTFTLTADANFGATYGLKSAYFSSRTTNMATSGLVRLANTESISWRNAAASGNLPLTVNASDQLTYNGVVIASSSGALFQDSTTSFYDNADATKLAKFELSGITTGTTRTFTLPDANTTLDGIDNTATLTNKSMSGSSNTFTNIPLATAVTGTLPVANGGTGLTSGTSGGVLAYTAAGTIASSGLLSANQLVIGGGAGVAPSSLAAGTQYQSLTMGAANPGWSAVNLAQSAAITGALPVLNGGTNKTSWSQYSIPFAASTSAFGEDNTNLTWDDSAKKMYVGSVAGNGRLNVNAASGSYGGLYVNSTSAYAGTLNSQGSHLTLNLNHAVNGAANGAAISLNMSRGTTASRSQTLSGDRIGYVMANGMDNLGSFGTVGAANLEFYAAGNITSTSQPGEIRLSTTPTSTITPKERLRLKQDGSLEFVGATSGHVAIIPSATTTTHTLTLPSAQGAADTVLTNNGSGTLSWATGGSGSGGINYITATNGNAIGAWTSFDDGAVSTPGDGSGAGAASSFAVSTNSDLRGTTNFLFTHTAASNQGEGFSYDFSIDPSDKGKVLQISFEYLVSSGTFADDGLQFWIYDVTNAALIQPAPYLLKNSSIIEKFAMEFQTSSNSTSYRLIGFVPNTTATAYTIRFDNWNLGPQAKLYGSAVTDWVSFTPTGSWSTNTTYTGFKRRVGEIQEYDIKVAVAGAPTSAALTVNLGATIDTAKLAGTDANVALGYATIYDATGILSHGVVAYNATDSVKVLALNAAGTYVDAATVTQAVPFTFASGDYVRLKFSVPIAGASSSQIMSSDASTREVSFKNTGTPSGTLAAAYNTVNWPASATFDTVGGWDGSANYSVKVPGRYRVSANVQINGTFTVGQQISMRVVKTGVTQNTSKTTAGGSLSNMADSITTLVDAVAGDTIAINIYCDATTPTYVASDSLHNFTIERISGPSQIAASESVSALYTGAPPTGTLTNSYNTTSFSVKVKDSHSAFNGTSYTVPVSGTYSISAATAQAATYVAGKIAITAIFIDGVQAETKIESAGGANLYLYPMVSVHSRPLLAGQVVTIRSYNDATTPTFGNQATQNYFSIVKTGNY